MRDAPALLRILLPTLLVLLAGSARAQHGPPSTTPEVGLLLRDAAGTTLPATVLETAARLSVTGMIVRGEVTQRFRNPTDAPVEGVYLFPLPDDAAVDRLRLVVGQRVIEGRIRERAAARRRYEAAREAGHKASLVAQQRPDVFTTAVANIGPGEVVEVRIAYQHDARYEAGRFSLRFPTWVAPRVDPTVQLAALGTPPLDLAALAAAAGPPLRLEVRLEPGLPLRELWSRSHDVHVARAPGDAFEVRLSDGVMPAARDFWLEWEPEPASAPRAALLAEVHDEALYGLLLVMPPHDPAAASRLIRETVFVIDTSGSMRGRSMPQAKRALQVALARLAPRDHFNVVAFDSEARAWSPASVPARPAAVERARRWVEALEASGGTEMLPALELALAEPTPGVDVRQVVFVTDGAVANEDELFGFIERHLGRSRLFPVGIGSAPNAHFLNRAARFGRGSATWVQSLDDVEAEIGALLARLESPVLSEIELDWGGADVEVWPPRVPDLYLGEPLVVAVRLASLTPELTVHGRRADERWSMRLPIAPVGGADGVHKLWARRKIASLLDGAITGADPEATREAVVALGLRHHLVSKYTSLVAVDATPGAAGFDAEEGALLPRTATTAPRWLLLATLLLGAAALVRARSNTGVLPTRGSGGGGRP